MNTFGHRMPVLNHFLCYSISRARRKLSLKGAVRHADSFLHVSKRAVNSSAWLFIWFIFLRPGEESSQGRKRVQVPLWCAQRHRGNRPWKHRPELVEATELNSYLSNLSSTERQWDGQQLAPLAQVEIGRQLYLNIIFDCKNKQTKNPKTHSDLSRIIHFHGQ